MSTENRGLAEGLSPVRSGNSFGVAASVRIPLLIHFIIVSWSAFLMPALITGPAGELRSSCSAVGGMPLSQREVDSSLQSYCSSVVRG